MRDFGFWLRMIAITQLFAITLAHYGDAPLSPDNPLLNLDKRPPPPKPLSEVAAEALPKGAEAVRLSTAMQDEKQRQIAGWGGAPEPDANWDEGDEPGSGLLTFDTDEDEDTDWGRGLAP